MHRLHRYMRTCGTLINSFKAGPDANHRIQLFYALRVSHRGPQILPWLQGKSCKSEGEAGKSKLPERTHETLEAIERVVSVVGENFTLQVATPKLEKSWGTHARTGARPYGNRDSQNKF